MALTQNEKADIFTGHLPLARQMASRFSKKYGLPLTTVLDEAQSILALVVARWDAGGGRGYVAECGCNKTSWIWRALYWDLLTFCTRGNKHHKRERESESIYTAPARFNWLERFYRNLGEDARIVCETILFAPAEIIDDITANAGHSYRNRAYRAVWAHLRAKGWAEERVELAFAEIEDGDF